MGLFGFGKRNQVIDLAERYRQQREKEVSLEPSQDDKIPTPEPGDSDFSVNSPVEKKRQKLVKRIVDMTGKIDELSSQLYLLQQRIEVLEKKADVSRAEGN